MGQSALKLISIQTSLLVSIPASLLVSIQTSLLVSIQISLLVSGVSFAQGIQCCLSLKFNKSAADQRTGRLKYIQVVFKRCLIDVFPFTQSLQDIAAPPPKKNSWEM